jgi:hypothetical protein
MKKFGLILVAVGMGLAVSVTAAAETAPVVSASDTAAMMTAASTTPFAELANILFSVLGSALVLLVNIYVPRVARALEKRLAIDIPDPIEAEAGRLAARAITYAEEKARAGAKELGEKLPSHEKLDLAAAYFRDHASARVKKWISGKVESFIHSKLGELRAKGSQESSL